ncbi:protein suppressor of sable-like [Wyeomyia smithii]|uniref:protein suppressor of sable-like n=1 Tax=Wyeomyia smithii TaxID=174621 RepID=UPI00246815FC|nr:protein suppressor of sable-like [Wyeomyia smithii]XP_055534868.1 protein suppressor of sable-like [Wyeomyia smithii]
MSEHEDLEDGEIEDDEEDVEIQPITPSETTPTESLDIPQQPLEDWDDDGKLHEMNNRVEGVKKTLVAKTRKIEEVAPPKNLKRSKPAPVVDDWATSVENAIASALKKDGVQPPMPSISNRFDDNECEIPAKRKKKDKHKKKNIPEKVEEMEELDLEYEMMNVRGGSPRPMLGSAGDNHPDRSDSEVSYSSDDSRDRERERDRERRDRDRERDREYNRRKRKNRQRNRANRDNRKRKREDSDDDKHHSRNSGPRKMELCKFYLMDCCAKREKCLYMHSDFPCKYYYLGLKCKDKEKCLFSHGEPLTEELRAILLKHLETAPQEILGDFPRISRDSATTMISATHRKLLDKYGITDKPNNGDDGTSKIPSLLEMIGVNDRNSMGQNKNRKSRWCEKVSSLAASAGGGKSTGNDDFLSLKYLTGVISQDQIVNLEKMGIQTLDQINQLTVAQLNELGLSINQIHELQLNSLNMKKLRENITKPATKADEAELPDSSSASSLSHSKDLDMRITPSHTALSNESSDMHTLGGKDIDMRFLPLVNTAAQEAVDGDNSNSQEENLELVSKSLSSLIKTPTVDYSQYLKDSNLNDDDDMDNTENADKLLIAHEDEDDDDDDENNLKISIDDEEPEEKVQKTSESWDSDNEQYSLPQPAKIEDKFSSRMTQKIDYTKPFGMYKSTDEELERTKESCILERFGIETTKKKIDTISRKSMYASGNSTITDSARSNSPSSNKHLEVGPQRSPIISGWTPNTSNSTTTISSKSLSHQQSTKPTRPSIYDDPGNSNSSDGSDSESKSSSMYTDRDKDMRLNFLNLDAKPGEDGNLLSDVDLRLPFKPIMTNYIPATEIDGSITSHAPIVYKVSEVDIPNPNYKDIRRNTPRPERTKDPRLRRIFGIFNDDEGENSSKSDPFMPGIRSPPSSRTPLSPTGPIVPRVDPRTKRNQENKTHTQNNAPGRPGNPTQLDVQTILQRSAWYTDLSSKHKIMVNQQLAILTTDMKKYHSSDKSTEKLADFMQLLAGNQMLQFILTNLNVYVDDNVAFCEVPLVPPTQPPPLMSVPPPNIALHPIGMMPPVGLPPPNTKPPSLFDLPRFNCPPEVRPGLLGVAPNMPFEQFLAMGQVNKNNNPPPLLEEWNDDYDDGLGGLGGSGFTPNYERNFGNVRNNPIRNNNRPPGNTFRNHDRWNNSGGGTGGGNNQNRRNNNHRRMDKKK